MVGFSFSFSEASIASPPFFSFSKGAITVSVSHTRDFFLVFVAAVDDFFGLGGVAMRSSSSSSSSYSSSSSSSSSSSISSINSLSSLRPPILVRAVSIKNVL